MLQNLCDTHTHTLFSLHAYSTVEENVRAASEASLELLGIADHFSAMVSATGDVREYQHLLNMTCWPRRWHGVTLLRAAEVDILEVDGTLFGQDQLIATGITGMPVEPQSLFDHCTRSCDYLIASVHHEPLFRDLPAAQATDLYLKALSHPKVLMAGHMAARPWALRRRRWWSSAAPRASSWRSTSTAWTLQAAARPGAAATLPRPAPRPASWWP